MKVTVEEWNGITRDTYKEEVHMNKKMHETDKKKRIW